MAYNKINSNFFLAFSCLHRVLLLYFWNSNISYSKSLL